MTKKNSRTISGYGRELLCRTGIGAELLTRFIKALWRIYVVRRLILFIPLLVGVSMAVFVLIRMAPGNPAYLFAGPTASLETIRAMEIKLGLDQSIWVQCFLYMKNLVHGDLGVSLITSQPVLKDLAVRLPATLELITFAMLLIIVVLVPLGILSAVGGNLAGRLSSGYGFLAGSLPDFWWGLMLIFVFYTLLGWAPVPFGRIDFGLEPPVVTGFLTIDTLLANDLAAFRSALGRLILPGFTLAFIFGAPVLKHLRTTMATGLQAHYIQYAHLCGLSRTAIFRYAFRNSIIPPLTMAGMTYVYLVGAAALVESVFAWGGFGQYAVQAAISSDYMAVSGTVLAAMLIALCIYLILDLVYTLIDPRVRN
jgi:ABC-type dipeptide/oligopeptide/nickel transport system permease component